jgi:hypothetical protein
MAYNQNAIIYVYTHVHIYVPNVIMLSVAQASGGGIVPTIPTVLGGMHQRAPKRTEYKKFLCSFGVELWGATN